MKHKKNYKCYHEQTKKNLRKKKKETQNKYTIRCKKIHFGAPWVEELLSSTVGIKGF